VLEAAVIGLRWLQYGGAVVFLGVPLFLLYGVRNAGSPDTAWARPLLILAAVVVGLGSLAALVAQTAVMAGSLGEALKPATLSMMITGTALGMAMVIRAGVAFLGLAALVTLGAGRLARGLTAAAGLIVSASFAWTGHGAATEGPGGPFHLAADIVHMVAAALWLGALAALTLLLLRRTARDAPAIHRALRRFSGLGSLAVALLVLTGLVNSGFLVGPTEIPRLGSSPYGQLLIAKLALFVLMLGLAAANRFRLTPALGSVLDGGEDPRRVLAWLRRSVVAEIAIGILVLGMVAWMGTLAPPASL